MMVFDVLMPKSTFFPPSSSTAVKVTLHTLNYMQLKKKKSCSDLVSNCCIAWLFSTGKSTGVGGGG